MSVHKYHRKAPVSVEIQEANKKRKKISKSSKKRKGTKSYK